MPTSKLTSSQRRSAIGVVEKRLMEAQDACEDLDFRDQKRIHVSGVDLHGVLGEMRDACEHVNSRVPGGDQVR